MKRLIVLVTCFCSVFNVAQENTFSSERLKEFYDEFLCAEKNELASVHLTSPCSLSIGPFFPPSDPSPPPFVTGLLPIVIVNNSGLPDDEVYVLLTAKNTAATSQVWGVIDTTPGPTFGQVTLQDVSNSDNSTTFSYALSSLPVSSKGYVFYVPELISGLVWFSMDSKLSMTVSGGSIVQPNFTDSSDPNYYTNFDIFELTYLLSGAPQVSADATAVSFFSIPLYGYLAGATSTSSHTGLYQPRSYIMSQAAATLSTATESSQWNKLLLKNGSQILRLLSTGKAIGGSIFDANYLDNLASYGYSYIGDIWNGAMSFYRNTNLNLTVEVTSPSSATYNYAGRVQLDNTFLFTSNDGGPDVTFPAPVITPTPSGTTTFNIFSAINFIPGPPVAGTADDAVSKLVQEAMIAGLVPTTDTLSLSYLSSNQPNFYKVNSNLTPPGGTTGPWFDLYSKALHALGSIYTFGFDEALWPQVLLGAPFTDGITYLGITIGNVQ